MALEEGADIAVLLHSDGQYARELLPALLKPLQDEKVDVVQGSRSPGGKALDGGMPLYKHLANRVLSTLENTATGLHFAEYDSGYMSYSRKAPEAKPVEKPGNTFHFDVEMFIVAGRPGARVKDDWHTDTLWYGKVASAPHPLWVERVADPAWHAQGRIG